MVFSRSQHFSGRSLSSAGNRSQAGGGFSSFRGHPVAAGGLHSGAGLVLGSGAGLGFGSGAGLGFGSGSGMGFGSAFGAGGGSLLRTIGGGVSAAGGSSFSTSFRSGGGSFADAVSNIINEKKQLQILNDRLASYLEKVKQLETTNHELNEKLRAFTANRVQSSFNLEPYELQIKPLREKFLLLIQDHTRIALAVDNAKLAADDFRMKFETELAMRQSVEGDIGGLRSLKQEYDSTNSVLKQELTALEQQRNAVRDAHQQEMISLRGHMAGTVTVDIKEIESADLSRVLAEIRSEYETDIEKNRREAENWYTKQVEKKQAETALITETTVSGSSEITDSRKQTLSLQTQMDAALMEKAGLEQRLLEVQAQYQTQLLSLSQLAGALEGELSSVRESAIQQSRDYQLLLSTKVQLENEIATYKRLLATAGDISVTMVTDRKLELLDLVDKGGSSAVSGAVGGVTVSASTKAFGSPAASADAVDVAKADAVGGVTVSASTKAFGSPAAVAKADAVGVAKADAVGVAKADAVGGVTVPASTKAFGSRAAVAKADAVGVAKADGHEV